MEQDFNTTNWTNPCPKYDCRKDKCVCGLEMVRIPASLGDDNEDSKVAPYNGAYCNSLVIYEANDHVYIYTKEGIPTLIDVDASDISTLEQEVVKAQRDIAEFREDIDRFAYFFDTVADMMGSTQLSSGDYARTLGYRYKDDGGSGVYKIRAITSGDSIDGMTTIAVNGIGLIAELISSEVYPETLGAYADGVHDDYLFINKLLSLYTNNNKTIKFSSAKTYAIGTGISIVATRKMFLDFNGCTLKALNDMQIFKFRNSSLRNEPNGYIKNLNLDCNNIATSGLVLDGSWRITYDTINILAIPIGGTGVRVGLTTSMHNGGNLLNNIRGTGVENSEYSSASDYNTFIDIISGSSDNTYNNIDYTCVKRGVNVGAFSTFNNVHGFVGGDNMYIGSYFMKFTGSALVNNVYPDTQQFGIIVSNNPLTINNIIFVFNDALVSPETLSTYNSYGVVAIGASQGKSTNISGIIIGVSSDIQPLYPSSSVTVDGTTYYKPTTCSFNTISSSLGSVSYDTAIMNPILHNDTDTYASVGGFASPSHLRYTVTMLEDLGNTNIEVAHWGVVYSNYKVDPGYHPAIIQKADNSVVSGYIRITDQYNVRIYGPLATGDKIIFDLPMHRKKTLE